MERYIVDGQPFDVAPHRLDDFLKMYPNASKTQDVEKTIDVVEPDVPATSQINQTSEGTESNSENTSLELPDLTKANHEFKPYELLEPEAQDQTSISNVSTDMSNLIEHEEQKQDLLEVYKEKNELADEKPAIETSSIVEQEFDGEEIVDEEIGDNTTFKNINRKTTYNYSGDDDVVYNYTDKDNVVTQEDIDVFEANLYKANLQEQAKKLSDGRLLTEEEKSAIETDPQAFINDFDAALSVVNDMYDGYKTDWTLFEDYTSGVTIDGQEYKVEESDMDAEKFLNRKQKNQNEAYEDWAASFNVDFNNNFKEQYKKDIDVINDGIQQKYVKQMQIEVDAFQETLLQSFQQRQQDGEFAGMSQEQVQQMFANEVNVKQQEIGALYSEQANQEINKYVGARYDDYVLANENEFKKKQLEFFQNYIPPTDLIGREKYDDLTKQFRINGWETSNKETKKLMLDNAWTNIEIGLKQAGITDETEILNRKTEYYHKFWNDMTFDISGDMTRFGIDEIAKDLLEAIDKELERVTPIVNSYNVDMVGMVNMASYGVYTKEQYEQAASEYNNLKMAKDKLDVALERPEELAESGFAKFFQGMIGLESGLDYIPIVGGIASTFDSLQAYSLFKKKESGEELSPAEQIVLSSLATKQAADNKFNELTKGETAYNSGQGLAKMFPWVAEIAATRGVFTGVKKVVKDKLDRVLKEGIYDGLIEDVSKRTIKGNIIDGLSVVIAAGAQSAVIPTNYLNSTIERMTPQAKLMITSDGDDIMNQLSINGGYALDENGNYDVEAFDKAFAKAFGVNFLEYFTERLGAGFPKLGKFIKNDVLNDPEWLRRTIASRYFNKKGLTGTGQFMNSIGNKVGFDGMFGEMAEEIINLPLQNLVEGNDVFEGLDSQFLKETGLTMGVMQVMFSAPGTVSKIIKGKHNKVYRIDGENFSTAQELQQEYNRRRANGENPLVYIKNDSEGALLLYSAMMKQDGNADALQWENTRITFTDIKTANEIKAIEALDSDSRNEVESIEEKIEKLEDDKADVKESSMISGEEKTNTAKKIDKKIQELETKRQEILKPVIEKQAKDQSKTTIASVTDLAESMFGEQMNVKEVTNGTLVQIFGQEADGSFGSIKINEDGSKTIYVNAMKKNTREGVNVAAHEFLHAILRTTLQNNPSTAYALGNSLLNMLGDIQPFINSGNQRFIDRLNVYRDPSAAQQVPLTSAKQAEEVLTLVADAIATGQMTYNRTTFEKIGSMFSRVFKNIGVPYKFKNPMDVFNFLEDYSKGIQNGTLNEAMRIGAIDGVKVSGDIAEIDQTFRDMMSEEDGEENAEQFSQDASDSVQRLYDTSGVDGAFEIFQLFKPITTRIANKYREVPGFDLEMMISEIEVGRRGIYDLIRDYDPNSGVPLAAYINKYLPSRAIESANRVLKEQFEDDVTEARGVAAEETAEIKAPERKVKLINVAERLGIQAEVLAEIEAAGIDPKVIFNFKKVPNAALQAVSNLTGIPVNKLKNLANLSKGELASMQMFVRKNVGLLINMLPQGFDSEGKATGVPKTLLDAFYNKRSSRAKTKAGLKTQVKKTSILDSDFLEVFGIVEGVADRTDRNTSARALAMANLMGKIITNQALRTIDPSAAQVADGMSDVLFSKDVSDTITYMEPTWSKIVTGMGVTPLDISGKDRGAYINWLATVAAKELPRSFFTGGNLYAAGAKNINVDENGNEYTKDENGRQLYVDAEGNITLKKTNKKLKEYTLLDGKKVRNNNPNFKAYELSLMPASPKYAFANAAQFEAAMEGVEFASESSNIAAMAKVSVKYGKFTNAQAQEWLSSNQDLLDQSDQGFKEVWSILQDLIKESSNVAFVGALLESSAVNQGHFMRTGARYGFHNTLGLKNVEEHTQPATEFAKILFTLSKMGVVDQYIDNAMKAYIQGGLPKIYDNLLKKLGEFNYVSQIPKEWQFKVFTGEVPGWIRYFNPNVNNNAGGINPNFIVLANGSTVAQEYNVGINSSLYSNANVVSMQQDLLFQIFSGQITQEQANKKLNEYINKYPVKVKTTSEARLEKADQAFQAMSRDAEPRGMSTFDFDDTLAFTKSGIRLTMPNPSGKPQPGRKVIFMAGAPGAGKSTVIKGLDLLNQGFKIVNQDIALERLMKESEMPTDMREMTQKDLSTFGRLSGQARKLAGEKRAKYKGQGEGMIIDGTGASLQVMEKAVKEFKEAGYDVQMVFVETTMETAVARNKARKERSLKTGIVKGTWEKVIANKEAYKNMFGERFAEIKTDNIQYKDAMPADLVKKLDSFTKGYIKNRINAEDFASRGADLLAQGAEFDFSEFNKVVDGTSGPLLQKMKNQIKKYGTENVFVLTARMQEAAEPIHQFLKDQGVDISLENITGLGNSTGDAKAAWFLGKYAEGYNDMYFVDDALSNVEAVRHVFDQLDIKGKSVQVRFSKDIDSEFNNILERTKGVGAQKVFSRVEGRKRGKNLGGFTLFVPPSAEDFTGLLRYFVGTGKQGDADIKFFEEYLVKPFAKADREMSQMKQGIRDQYRALNKEFRDVKKKLGKLTDIKGFTFDAAIRVYLYDKAGYDIPGLAESSKRQLVNLVKNDPSLRAYADGVSAITKQQSGYIEPTDGWDTGNIAMDLQELVDKVSRVQFLQEWIENRDIIFSEKNLNKIEATYGSNFRSSLEDILYRMQTGRNRPKGRTKFENQWNNWINSSVGAIMFFNARSAVLQTLSTVNFINFQDNNIFAAGKAFANQKQYWADFSFLFNSDFLKNRRAGLATNVNEAELASAVAGAKNKAMAALRYLLKIGFTPTQVADSFAIASGGATFYRNRLNKYLKEGMSQADAESQAMLDFREIAEETQQSARPDRISQQQASNLGRIILAFANTPMQYNRLIKKAAGDLINRRGDWRSNVSRILYYGAIQNFIFAALQNALFAMAFESDDDKEEIKEQRILNSMLDSLLRGSGIYGAALATIKNVILEYAEQEEKGFRADYGQVIVEALNVSPPIGSKARKLYSAMLSRKYNKEAMNRMSMLDYNNPTWQAIGNVVEATTNIPMARAIRKMDNLREAMNQDNTNLQRLFLTLGWSSWDLNVGERVVRNEGKDDEYTVFLDERRQAVEDVKTEIKNEKKQDTVRKKEEKKKQKEIEGQKEVEKNLEKQKEEGEEATCAAVTSSGNRCKREPVKGGFCTVHEKTEKRSDGKEVQCSGKRTNGDNCKMSTTNKSGLCFYHD